MWVLVGVRWVLIGVMWVLVDGWVSCGCHVAEVWGRVGAG